MTPTDFMIQVQYQKSDSDAASDSALNWQSHSHPVALMGLEVKLEGQVCVAHWSATAIHQFPTMTYRRGMSSQVGWH